MYPSSYKKGNWGRWGDKDEIGTLNLVTPDVIKNAARLIKRGRIAKAKVFANGNTEDAQHQPHIEEQRERDRREPQYLLTWSE